MSVIQERFEAFHRDNPHVYREIVQAARKLKRAGVSHYGIAAIFEKLRFDFAIRTKGDTFKLNNNHRAFYARMIMRREPDLRGFFEVRGQDLSEADAFWLDTFGGCA